MGNIIMRDKLLDFLVAVQADEDFGGRPKVGGSITSFMGAGDEFLIGDDAYYLKDGEPHNLAAELNATERGLEIVVIG
jgi:hypothetical protein